MKSKNSTIYFICILLAVSIIALFLLPLNLNESTNNQYSNNRDEVLESFDLQDDVKKRQQNEYEKIPEKYRPEINKKLEKYFTKRLPFETSFTTNDHKLKCSFRNSPFVKNIPFFRTIIPEYKNSIFQVDTTACPSNTSSDSTCNKKDDYNIHYKLFHDETPYIDKDISRNNIFLELPDGRGYSDFSLVSYEDISPTFRTTYGVCKPKNILYSNNYERLDNNFPCAALVCRPSEEEEVKRAINLKERSEQFAIQEIYQNDSLLDMSGVNSDLNKNKGFDFSHTKVMANQLYLDIMKQEHQSQIDRILDSFGFSSWIELITKNHNENRKIRNFTPTELVQSG